MQQLSGSGDKQSVVWHDPMQEHANRQRNHDWMVVVAYIGCLTAVSVSLVVYKYYMIAESDKLYRAWVITIAAFTFIMLVVTVSVRRFFDQQITSHLHTHWVHALHTAPSKRTTNTMMTNPNGIRSRGMPSPSASNLPPTYRRAGGWDEQDTDPLMPRVSWRELMAAS